MHCIALPAFELSNQPLVTIAAGALPWAPFALTAWRCNAGGI